jgi:hypothetical protein
MGIGCGNGGKPSRAKAEGAPCGAVADHVIALMAAAQEPPPGAATRFRDVIAARCAEDAWSAEARACMAAVARIQDIDRCKQHLTEVQAAALDRHGRAAAEELDRERAAAEDDVDPFGEGPPERLAP